MNNMLDYQTYAEYLTGDHWRQTRQHAIWAAGGRCQLCGSATRALEVHHVSYDNLGAEGPEDLAVLCAPCHSAYEKGLEPARETTIAAFIRDRPFPCHGVW